MTDQPPMSVREAIAKLKEIRTELEAETGQLTGMDPDKAFDLGYGSAIRDLAELTGNQED